ncbi:MAG: glycosyltransferase family 39 protein [Anaerolineae bacterium]
MDQLHRDRWRWHAALAGLTILALLLRLHHVASNSYWLDEAISVLIARLPVSLILSNAGRSSHPGLYYLLLHHWLRPAETEAWVRGLSVLWGVLTVPAIFLLGVLLFNRKVALLASLMLAVAPFHVAYSQEARMYSQITCLGVLAVICFHRALESGPPHWWLATGVVVAAAAATHLFAFLLLAAMTVYALLYRRDCLAKLMWVNLVAIIVVVPHLASLLGRTQRHLGGLRPLVGWDRPGVLFPLTAIHLLLVGYSITPRLMPVALFSSLAVFVITLWEAGRTIRRRSGAWRPLVLLSLVVGIALLGPFGVARIQPIFLPERTLLIALPSMLLLIAWGMTEVERRTPLPVLGVGLAVVMVVSLWGYYSHPDFQKPPLRQAAMLIQERFEPGDAVLHTSDGSYLPFLVCLDHPDGFLLQGDPDPRKSEAVYRMWGGHLVDKGDLHGRFDRLWLVVALDHSVEFQRDALAWFESRYPLLARHDVEGIGVHLLHLTVDEFNDQAYSSSGLPASPSSLDH